MSLNNKDLEISELRKKILEKTKLLNELRGIRWIVLPKRVHELEEEIRQLTKKIEYLENG